MGENEMKDDRQISSVEIINKSGISRATLNNYIKMGILPHPLVKKPDDNTVSKAKQIGYFPLYVLDTLDKIKQYKQGGRRMVEIYKLLTDKPILSVGKIHNTGPVKNNGEIFLQTNTETKKDIRLTLKQGALHLLYFSILVAEIQDSAKMRIELPPDEYITLTRQILKSIKLVFKKHFGVYGKHPDHGMAFYFLKDCDSSYLMNAVVCALELRQMMKKISHEWKMKNEYFDDLFLNIGISEGREYLGTIPAAATVEHISLGNSINSARLLSDLASSGAIWATKNLLNLLDEKDRRQIRFGIYRSVRNREALTEKIFSRVMDLVPQDDPGYSKYMDIWTLPVTEIHALR
jgi:class 3 adenylate cyclase